MGLERNDIEIERFGNISYVDPSNYFEAYSKIYDRPVNGTFSDGINFKYEDYNMAVDLEVQISNRYSCGLSGATNTYKYSSTNGTLSFFGGKKLNNEDDTTYLTTNFTNVSNINPDSNGECFGIESINITYQSWLFPEVNIRFVDVRGAAVMQPLEKEYLDGESKYNLIYKSFFLYPYPIYTLKVKGFYGMGVSYKLALEKSTIEFDSSNGNFIINAKFIGYMFGIYTDIPVSFVAVAPYLSDGRNYWIENTTENGPFRFVDKNGLLAGPMCTIPEFRKKVSEASKKYGDDYTRLIETQDINNINYKDKEVIENTINALKSIKNKNLVDNNKNLEFFTDLSPYYDIAFYEGADDNKIINNLVENITDIINSVKDYDKTYTLKKEENLSGFLPYYNLTGSSVDGLNIINYKNYGIGKVSYIRDENNEFKELPKDGEIYSTIKEHTISGDYVRTENINGNSSKYFILNVSNFKDIELKAINKFKEKEKVDYFSIIFIPRKKSNIQDESINNILSLFNIIDSKIRFLNNKKYEEINNEVNKLVEDVEDLIGFYPSIYNIYKLLFAHFDTFIHCFYSRMKNILKELNNSEKSNRLKTNFSFSEDLTDAPRHVRNGSLGNFYPPFTGFYKVNEDNSKKEFVWPPSIDARSKDMEEMLFIDDMLKSSGNIEALLPEILNKEKDEESLNKAVNGYIVNHNNFIPINGYDFKNFSYSVNPYYFNGLMFSDGDDLAPFEALLKFAIRTLLNASYSNSHGFSYKQLYKDSGKNEAINLFCSIPNLHINFKRFVDLLKGMSSKDFVNYITTNNEYFAKPKALVNNAFFEDFEKDKLCFSFTKCKGMPTAYPLKYDKLISVDYDRQKFLKNGENINVFTESNTCEYAIFNEKHPENNENAIFFIENGIKEQVKNSVEKIKSAVQINEINYPKKNIETKYAATYNEAHNRIQDIEHKNNNNKSVQNTENFIVRTFAKQDLAQKLYSLQDNIYVKAYLFLQPVIEHIDDASCGIDINPYYKINFVREGSYYWMDEYKSKNNGDIEYPSDWDEKNKIDILSHETFYKNKAKYTKYFTSKNFEVSAQRKALAISEFKKFAESINDVFYLFSESSLYEEERNGIISNYLSDVVHKDSNAFKTLQKILTDLYFNQIDLIEYDFPYIKKKDLEEAFDNFKSTLVELKNRFYTSENLENIGATSGIKFDSYSVSDLKLSLYLSLKNVYDKWLSFANNNEERWSLANANSDFNRFLFIDTFYNNIGYKLSVNPTKIASWLGRYFPSSEIEGNESVVYDSGKSFYEILVDIAQECGGTLMAFPQNFTKLENGDDRIRKMFTPVSINENWCEDSSVFVFMYNYKPASHLGVEESVNPFDMNGFNPNGDSLYLTKEDFNGYHYTNDDANIPAFGVSFGKQNQSIFTNVTLNTNTTTVTEASIAGTMNIAAKASEGPRETTLFGQDLYKIYGSYSYECNVEMMGNMQIMPTMFFQLNNIPLWKGVYQIKKVSHDIKAGDISTKIEGIKVNKYTVPILTPELILTKLKDFNYDDKDYTGNTIQTTFAGSDEGNGSVDISKNTTKNANGKYDFDIESVSKEMPLICLTPAHGPYTEKKREYEWSTKLVNMIAEKLRKSNKMPWLKNNVHTCNKNGAHTTLSGYSTDETRTLIERFGENNVISIVPHWNGGGANRLQIFWELGPIGPKSNVREDKYIANEESLILAKCFAEIFKNRPQPPATNPAMPYGAMDGNVEVGSLRELSQRYVYKDKHGKDKYVYDGAVMLRCPAILVETWYGDYSSSNRYNLKKWEKYIGETLPVGERHDQNVDEYTIMASWLESDEGLNYISDLYAQGIYAYLSDREERRKKGEIK